MDIEFIATYGGYDHCAWLGYTEVDEWHIINEDQVALLTWFTTISSFRIPRA